MKIFLRCLSIIYAFAAARHIGNIVGLGEIPFDVSPLSWQITDLLYGVLDTIAAIGLWRLRWWGVAAFLTAAVSEILLFSFATDWLEVPPEYLSLLRGFIVYHVVAIGIYAGLRWRETRASGA